MISLSNPNLWSEMKSIGTKRQTILCLVYCMIHCILPGCSPEPDSEPKVTESSVFTSTSALFTLLPETHTRITFNNQLTESTTVNTFFYINAYNGAGVAIGDINNDGLPDLFFAGNQLGNQLYLNKGNLVFEDITPSAQIEDLTDWCTGVTMADVNADGLLDIYVCRAFNTSQKALANLLYINNGDLTFSEQAKDFGIADTGSSTQATFFDYDNDGDLDLMVANHFQKHSQDHELSRQGYAAMDHALSDHLYRNNGDGSFTDVTEISGTLTYGSTLGIVAGDINNDGWTDVMLANDFQEPDFLFVNNGDGTFRNAALKSFKHTSYSSMGVDLADFNNDRLPDFIEVDMLAKDHFRRNTQLSTMTQEEYDRNVEAGYNHQLIRNVLQLNNGDGTFSDVAYHAGVTATDWSWSALFADFDNDQDKDLFVSNGLKRDIQDNDYKMALSQKLSSGVYKGDLKELLEMIPITPIANHFFVNQGGLRFSDETKAANLHHPGFSQGVAYADLDLDGDLDLVLNNMDSTASVYRNNSDQLDDRHFLRIKLEGTASNPFGFGTKVTVEIGQVTQYQQLTLTRGFLSSVEPILHFGLGTASKVNKVFVQWPDGRNQLLSDIDADQVLILRESDASPSVNDPWKIQEDPIFLEATQSSGIHFQHEENTFDDFAHQLLLPHKISQFGPKIAVGDVNGDGITDFFVGGAANQSGQLWIQDTAGKFQTASGPWKEDAHQEDIDSLLFDANGDSHPDLYVVSGGNKFEASSPALQDRLYLNDGKGAFAKAEDALPKIVSSGGCVEAADFDADGDMDLFVGGRLSPRKYPQPARSYLLRNTDGIFEDVTRTFAPALLSPGMVTSAVWMDVNKDNRPDLVVAGEWMPISVFIQKDAQFTDETRQYGLADTAGWWNTLLAEDIDQDGEVELVAGNLGLNYKYQARVEEPFVIYGRDFDLSGTYDVVLGYYSGEKCLPVRGFQSSRQQLPYIVQHTASYEAFAKADLTQIYGTDKLNRALRYEAKQFASCIFKRNGTGSYDMNPLPLAAQLAPIQGMVCHDFDKDGYKDLLLGGNFHVSEVETGRADAGAGLLLLGSASGEFKAIRSAQSGFYANGDVRDLALFDDMHLNQITVMVANNNDALKLFRTHH